MIDKGKCKKIAKPKSMIYTGLIATKGDHDFEVFVASTI
jgi:hypothetical protein